MYKKQFYEKYALLSLVKCYSNDLQVLLNDKREFENPDHQSDVLSIGIEVVEAITNRQGEERFIINEYFGKGMDGETLKKAAEERFSKINGKIDVVDGHAVYSHEPHGFRMSSRLTLIQSKIDEKLIKLNSHYKVFDNNWLYVFSHVSTVHQDEIESLDIHNEKVDGLSFDKVFIDCIDKIYVLSDKDITVEEISNETLKNLKHEALKKPIR